MTSMPHHHPFHATAIPQKVSTDPPAAVMITCNQSATRPPLGERPVANANVSVFSTAQANAAPDVPSKPLAQQQSHQRRLATPDHQVKSFTAVPHRQLAPQHTPAAAGKSGAPFKSPITLCFERMIGAGKCNLFACVFCCNK